MELYKKHRPRKLEQIIGQEMLVKTLLKKIERDTLPHAMMFSGPSGCGKTTLARILKRHLECSREDFKEINCADFRGVDMVRDIRDRMFAKPLGGKTRIWLIDECHQLSKDAQNAFLKILEDGAPDHAYFMLATTDPAKLLPTIRTRCTDHRVALLTPKQCEQLIERVCKAEGVTLAQEVCDAIVAVAEGSARKALVLLDQVILLDDGDEQLEAVQKSDVKQQAIELARKLLNPRCRWPEISKIIKGLDEDPESLRHMVLGYVTNVMLGGGPMGKRAYMIGNAFRDPFYETKRAGLVMACWEVIQP